MASENGGAVRRPFRFIHTADVHIGDSTIGPRRLAGLAGTVDAALATKADAILIAGDLFDSARVLDSEIEATLEHLARLSLPVVITAGNHDALGSPSIYERVRLSQAGRHVYFLGTPDGGHVALDHLQVTLWARGLVEHHPGNNPLAGYSRHVEGHWQVALAHGHFVPSAQKPDRSSPVFEDQIGALGCDYLALGHWHRFLDVSRNGTAAFYPGSPSEAGGSFASVNLVTLEEGRPARVERIPIEV